MPNTVLMIVKTALRRYAVRRDDLLDVRIALAGDALSIGGQPCLPIELGPLLDPADRSQMRRQRALIVALRRPVALLVDAVETFLEHADGRPLPALLGARLHHGWAIGALTLEGDLIVQLDLRAVAHSALEGFSEQARAD